MGFDIIDIRRGEAGLVQRRTNDALLRAAVRNGEAAGGAVLIDGASRE